MKTRIFIADDHAMLREGMRNLLEKEKDFELVGEAADGEEAVSMVGKLKPDIVIMDIVMPKLNGIEATKQIKQISPSTALLILTAYSDIRYIIGLLEAGACGYLLKNSPGKDVIRAIRAVRSGESVLDSEVTRKLVQRLANLSKSPDEREASGQLTSREIEILKWAARGLSNKELSEKLFISLRTVKAHMTNIFNKLGCSSRTDAIIKGLKQGYIDLNDIQ
ncbi:MAG: response regulator transcription factor [Dehalococcoidales bacterium]|jgi:DNA-binding NarL/FixJ family response regulator